MSALAELRRCLLMAAVLTAAGPAPDAGMQLTVTARVDDPEPVGTFRLLSTTAAR
jgi:hypothetical protein